MLIRPESKNCLKWWYFSAMCFVRGENFVDSAIEIHDWLSSQTEHTKSGEPVYTSIILARSSSKVISGMTSRKACDNAMYFASAVLSAISLCSLLHHPMGQQFLIGRCLRYQRRLVSILLQSSLLAVASGQLEVVLVMDLLLLLPVPQHARWGYLIVALFCIIFQTPSCCLAPL